MDFVNIFQFWYVFPYSVLVATFALLTGVQGSAFFAPFFIIFLRLPLDIAVGTAVITVVFGFGSGSYTYCKNNLIDYKAFKKIISFTIPAGIIGALVTSHLQSDFLLKVLLGIILTFLGVLMRRTTHNSHSKHAKNPGSYTLIDRSKRVYRYSFQASYMDKAIYFFGSFFTGLVGSGLGGSIQYSLVTNQKMPPRVAIGTSVFSIFFTIFSISLVYIFAKAFLPTLLLWTIPGVLIGGQIGSRIANGTKNRKLKGVLSAYVVISGIALLAHTFLVQS